MNETGIGASVRRKEDRRFLTGSGTYTDDISRPGETYAYVLRSPHAHAQVKVTDTSKAQAAPGVLAVLTGDDVAADGLGGMPCGFHPNKMETNDPPRPVLAQGTVNFVGDMVAAVIADDEPTAAKASPLVAPGHAIFEVVDDSLVVGVSP